MSGGALELAVLGLVWDARPAVPDGWVRWGWRGRAARAVRVGRLAHGDGRGGGRNLWSGAGGNAIELDQVGGRTVVVGPRRAIGKGRPGRAGGACIGNLLGTAGGWAWPVGLTRWAGLVGIAFWSGGCRWRCGPERGLCWLRAVVRLGVVGRRRSCGSYRSRGVGRNGLGGCPRSLVHTGRAGLVGRGSRVVRACGFGGEHHDQWPGVARVGL